MPAALGAQSPNHWTTREVPPFHCCLKDPDSPLGSTVTRPRVPTILEKNQLPYVGAYVGIIFLNHTNRSKLLTVSESCFFTEPHALGATSKQCTEGFWVFLTESLLCVAVLSLSGAPPAWQTLRLFLVSHCFR